MKLLNAMKAIGFTTETADAGPEVLSDIELAEPSPENHDLLVKVQAISVNPVDTKVRRRTQSTGSDFKVLGWDAVGEVIAVGDAVTRYRTGDQVWYAGDITRSGANAEYHLVDERIVGHKPASLSDVEAAALPLTAITAWELLFDRLQLAQVSAPCLLVVGAAGGVGSILVQLARKLTQAIVVGSASRPESEKWVRKLGAHHVINHHQPFQEQLKALGVDAVTHAISLNHTDQHFDQIVDVLAPQGKLALIDDPADCLDIKKMKLKSLSLHWELMFTRSMFQTPDMSQQGILLDKVSEMVDRGELMTTLGANYGAICAENIRRAHADIEAGKTIGKIVLSGWE